MNNVISWTPTQEEVDELIKSAGPKYAVYQMCKEVFVTADAKKAAQLVQENNWVITCAAFKANGDIELFLMRI